jgi:hypothetical protein
MKKFLVVARTSPLSTPISFLVATILAAGFWFTTARGVAGEPGCAVCHKRTTTLTFPCNSLEYRRHLDHGDPNGACGVTPTENP